MRILILGLYFQVADSPLTSRKKDQTSHFKDDGLDDSSYTDASGKQRQKGDGFEETKTNGIVDVNLTSEHARRRELALRQHAFFQLRLHIRRGANLVAMDRCGKCK